MRGRSSWQYRERERARNSPQPHPLAFARSTALSCDPDWNFKEALVAGCVISGSDLQLTVFAVSARRVGLPSQPAVSACSQLAILIAAS